MTKRLFAKDEIISLSFAYRFRRRKGLYARYGSIAHYEIFCVEK